MKTVFALAFTLIILTIATSTYADWKSVRFMNGNAAVIKATTSGDMIAIFCTRLPSGDKFTGVAYVNKRHAMHKNTQLQFQIPSIPEFALGVDFVWNNTKGQIVKADIGHATVEPFLRTARTSKFMRVTISRGEKFHYNETQHFDISKTSSLDIAWDMAYRGC